MSKFVKLFSDSAKEFKSVKTLSIAAMLTALCIVFGMFRIPVSDFLQIRFEFIPMALAGMLYGPVVAMSIGGISDILALVVNPVGGGYFPGFTISAVLGGLIYGLYLYKQRPGLIRILFTMLTIGIVINMLLGTLWLSVMHGTNYFLLLPVRIVKNLLTIPVNTAIFFLVSKPLMIVCQRLNLISRS